MFIPAGKRLLFDLETTGLLNYLREHHGDSVKSRIHILAIRDLDTRQTFVFRQNKRTNTIARGVQMLNEADVLVGHNIIEFDIPTLELFYPEFQVNALIRDTMVLSRVFFADEKERDFRRWKRGELDGGQIGRHGLEAWGQRMGLHKGDYSKSKAEQIKAANPGMPKDEVTRLVWSEWNQEMEDYCVQDLNVNEALWQLMVANPRRHSDDAITLEHRIHALMDEVTNNGFPFDVAGARALEAELRAQVEVKEAKAVEHFGAWWVPSKRKVIGKEYTIDVVNEAGQPVLGEDGKAKKTKVAYRPRPEFGEDHGRAEWGDITVPKKSVKFKDPMKGGDRMEGCPYCPVELKEFNPGSRPQIIDRLKFVYQWEPQDFTETGQPAVNDEVLRDLAHTIEICDELAELFYLNKRLGQLVDGKNGWIGKSYERGDGHIHPRFNVGGTVTNRASHSDPNIAQVPRVVFKKLAQWVEDGVVPRFRKGKIIYGIPSVDANGNETYDENLTPLCGPDGVQLFGEPKMVRKGTDYEDDQGELLAGFVRLEGREGVYSLDEGGKVETKKLMLKGRIGDHGFDSRNLFYVPEGWKLMGADQKGIELRALGHFMAEFDDGDYGRKVVEADVHDLHAQAMEIDRDTAKTFVYACVPMDTQVLTRAGWRLHADLIVGQDVMTYNATTGLKEWAPIDEIVRYKDAPLVELIGKNFAATCTPNHRWFTYLDAVAEVCLAENLTAAHVLIIDAPFDVSREPPPEEIGLSHSRTEHSLSVVPVENAPVWCLRTRNESFVMRQGDNITITGNTIYGAQDFKLGTIIDPALAMKPQEAKRVGAEMRRRLMTRIPALGQVVKNIQRQAKSGMLDALDGRKLFVRAQHAALNTLLQGAGATVAKQWCVNFHEYCLEDGLVHGWDGDFAILAWIHDELQVAVRDDPRIMEICERNIIAAAYDAGMQFGFRCPVDVDVKFGMTWAQTH